MRRLALSQLIMTVIMFGIFLFIFYLTKGWLTLYHIDIDTPLTVLAVPCVGVGVGVIVLAVAVATLIGADTTVTSVMAAAVAILGFVVGVVVTSGTVYAGDAVIASIIVVACGTGVVTDKVDILKNKKWLFTFYVLETVIIFGVINYVIFP